MHFLVLGCLIEYKQAAKRLEQIMDAQPGTPEAKERELLIRLYVNFEKDILKACHPVSRNKSKSF